MDSRANYLPRRATEQQVLQARRARPAGVVTALPVAGPAQDPDGEPAHEGGQRCPAHDLEKELPARYGRPQAPPGQVR